MFLWVCLQDSKPLVPAIAPLPSSSLVGQVEEQIEQMRAASTEEGLLEALRIILSWYIL